MTRPYTTATLAEEWGCSERLIRNLVASGELRAFKLGEKLIRIPPEAAEEYMRCRNTASPASGESGPSQYGTEAGDSTAIRLARATARKPKESSPAS